MQWMHTFSVSPFASSQSLSKLAVHAVTNVAALLQPAFVFSSTSSTVSLALTLS
jgi:hypothetical protein